MINRNSAAAFVLFAFLAIATQIFGDEKREKSVAVGDTVMLDLQGKLFDKFIEVTNDPPPPGAVRPVVQIIACVTHVDPAGKFFVSFHTFMGAQTEKPRVITVSGWVDPKEITSIQDPKPALNSEPKPVTDQNDKSLSHRYNRPIVVATAPERFAVKSWIPESPTAK